jgi:hypothetical protein
VVSDCTWIVDAKGEEGVGEGGAIVERVLGVGEGQVLDGDGGTMCTSGERKEGNVVWLRMLVGLIIVLALHGMKRGEGRYLGLNCVVGRLRRTLR